MVEDISSYGGYWQAIYNTINYYMPVIEGLAAAVVAAGTLLLARSSAVSLLSRQSSGKSVEDKTLTGG